MHAFLYAAALYQLLRRLYLAPVTTVQKPPDKRRRRKRIQLSDELSQSDPKYREGKNAKYDD
jgi:hypothetical protein